jgi:hypothetical protein
VSAENWIYNVFVDGVVLARLASGSVVRIDLKPGIHKVQFKYRLNSSAVFEVNAEGGVYTNMTCGFAPGRRGLKLTMRSPDNTPLSPADDGESFVA